MATDTSHAEGADKAAEPGMPQLDFSTFDNQIFWLLVTLVVIYFVLSRIALPRIASVLAERQGTITNDIAAAEDMKQKAVEAEDAYNKALADARLEANKIVADTKAEIQKDLDKAIAEADAEIGARAAEGEKAIAAIRASAIDDAGTVAKDIAKDIVASIAPCNIDAKSITAAVTSKLKG
jgi:F-type H+-transporting ATPase subunit b